MVFFRLIAKAFSMEISKEMERSISIKTLCDTIRMDVPSRPIRLSRNCFARFRTSRKLSPPVCFRYGRDFFSYVIQSISSSLFHSATHDTRSPIIGSWRTGTWICHAIISPVFIALARSLVIISEISGKEQRNSPIACASRIHFSERVHGRDQSMIPFFHSIVSLCRTKNSFIYRDMAKGIFNLSIFTSKISQNKNIFADKSCLRRSFSYFVPSSIATFERRSASVLSSLRI